MKHLFISLWTTRLGVIIGMLPGLTAAMGLSLLTTLTFQLESSAAITALLAMYVGSIYGGISLIPAMVGAFRFAEILSSISKSQTPEIAANKGRMVPEGRELLRYSPSIAPSGMAEPVMVSFLALARTSAHGFLMRLPDGSAGTAPSLGMDPRKA